MDAEFQVGLMEKNKIFLAESGARGWFVALVAYYVLALYLVPSSAKVEQFSFVYFALIIPAWLYVAGNWRYLLTGYSLASKSMALFGVLTGLVGLVRWDISLIYNAIFLATMAIVILNSKVYLTLAELNWLFLATVIGSAVAYGFGLTDYGFLIGQAEAVSCHTHMNWRVSLFRVLSESAMFSLVILIANIAYGGQIRGLIRGFLIFTAAYFLIFSGIRSIFAPAFIVVSGCTFIVLRTMRKNEKHRAVLFALTSIVVIALLPSLLLGSGQAFWENYVLRTATCDYTMFVQNKMMDKLEVSGMPVEILNEEKKQWILSTINRQCAARYALSLFADHPFGSSDIQPKTTAELDNLGGWCPSGQLIRFCASCVFPTYWLARAGIAAIPMFLCFCLLLGQAVKGGRAILSWTLIAFGMVSFTWGVMFVPYNVIFLLLMAMPAIAAANERRQEKS